MVGQLFMVFSKFEEVSGIREGGWVLPESTHKYTLILGPYMYHRDISSLGLFEAVRGHEMVVAVAAGGRIGWHRGRRDDRSGVE
jgi:hypothetical protein